MKTLKDKIAEIRERHAVLPGETIYPGHAKVDLPALLDALEGAEKAIQEAPHDGFCKKGNQVFTGIFDTAGMQVYETLRCTCWKSQALKAINDRLGV